MATQPTFPTDQLTIRPWQDPLVDRLGHDPRSAYVEAYWLGILGPSACWLLRRLADGMDAQPDGYDLDLRDAAASIGLRLNGGRHAPFMRTLGRLCQFRMARQAGTDTLEVRRSLPPLTLGQVDRLPTALREAHRNEAATLAEEDRTGRARRARHLALTLVQLGEDRTGTERQLREWRFNPTLSAEVAAWAWEAHSRVEVAGPKARPPVQAHIPQPAGQPGPTRTPAGEPSRSRPALDGAA